MKKIIKYASVGGLAFLAEYLAFLALEPFAHIIMAQMVSWGIGYAISFSGHRGVTFRAANDYKFSRKRQFILYGAVATTTLLLSTILVYELSMVIAPQLAKLMAMITTAILSYSVLSKLVFVR